MTVHLIKLCVGIDDIDHLGAVQVQRRKSMKLKYNVHVTRMTPRRQDELLDGGSMYWVIKGVLQVRQALVGLETVRDEDGISRCRIHLDPTLVPTAHQPKRPFQGWRYLTPDAAPADLDQDTYTGDMPSEMVSELRSLGLL